MAARTVIRTEDGCAESMGREKWKVGCTGGRNRKLVQRPAVNIREKWE